MEKAREGGGEGGTFVGLEIAEVNNLPGWLGVALMKLPVFSLFSSLFPSCVGLRWGFGT